MEKQIYFITGIDTGCGKTYVTGLLAKMLKDRGINVITQKLVQTGCTRISEDIMEHRRMMKCGLFPEDEMGVTCPYVFSTPASPHLAAKLDSNVIDIARLTNSTKMLAEQYDVILIEGVGGLHVPLTTDFLIIDYIKMLNYPVILVSSSKLGSINHTLLSIESCFIHHISLHALLYNRIPGYDKTIADDSFRMIKRALKTNYPDALPAEIGAKNFYEATVELFHIENNFKNKY